MTRPSIKINIPENCIDNENKGLCKVCGKSKNEFEKGRKKYCSEKCALEYSKYFETWGNLRKQALKRDNYTCQECRKKPDYLEVDHIIAFVNGGDLWDINNLRTLCYSCHSKKTKNDLYEKKYVKNGQKRLITKIENVERGQVEMTTSRCSGRA